MSDAGFWGVAGTLLGTAVGVASSWVKDWLFGRKERSRHAAYLAVRVVCILDEFISGCFDVVCSAGNGDLPLPKVHNPKFPAFPDDLDWKAISPELMYQILTLPTQIKAADSRIEFIDYVVAGPPDYEEAVEEREYQYALLGLKAEHLANRLRDEYTIPRRDDGDWNRIERFRKTQADIEAARRKKNTMSIFPFDVASTAQADAVPLSAAPSDKAT